MEVLRSSEALEQQILDDARKKAARILENAEKECVRIREEWERKLGEETLRASRQREAEVASLRSRLEASIPLDIMRARLQYMQESVTRSLMAFFEGLRQQEIETLLAQFLRNASEMFTGVSLIVYHHGIGAEEAKRLVGDNLPKASIAEVRPLQLSSGHGEMRMERGVILETVDGRMRYRATLKELADLLLEEQREELATSLLGKDA